MSTRAPRHQQPGDLPAAVADSVVEGSADRTVRDLDVGSRIDQGRGHVRVVAARRVVQRRLRTRTGLRALAGREGVGIGAGVDQQPDDLRAVGEVAGPVSDKMQWRPGSAAPADQPGRRQRGIAAQQSPDRLDVTGVNRRAQFDRDLVIFRDPLAVLLLTHRDPSCHRSQSGPCPFCTITTPLPSEMVAL